MKKHKQFNAEVVRGMTLAEFKEQASHLDEFDLDKVYADITKGHEPEFVAVEKPAEPSAGNVINKKAK